jgi:hypothetical protein
MVKVVCPHTLCISRPQATKDRLNTLIFMYVILCGVN